MAGPPYDLGVMVPTLIGALLSTIAAALVLLCYAILPIKRHFRHALIINLAVADLIVHGNNVISGLSALAMHAPLFPGPFCSATGFVSQMAFQAVDLSILSIAVVSLLAITGKLRYVNPSLRTYIGFTLCIWILPVITSSTGLGLDLYRPVTACWCWITRQNLGMRYALGHGVRVAVMLITIAIYTRLWIFLQRHYKDTSFLATRDSPPPPAGASDESEEKRSTASLSSVSNHSDPDVQASAGIRKTEVFSVHRTETTDSIPHPLAAHTSFHGPSLSSSLNASRPSRHLDQSTPMAHSVGPRRPRNDITKILLMNGYPVLYVLLWLPCLVNRVTEVVGTTPRWLVLLQATPQFIGLANAFTYGYNENIKRQIKQYWADHWAHKRSRPSAV